MLNFFIGFETFVSNETLRMLRHSLIYSKLQYGILIWGNAAKMHLHELYVRLNNLICIIAHSNKYSLMTNLNKNFNNC